LFHEAFLQPVVEALRSPEQQTNAHYYVHRLLSDLGSKNVESIAYLHDRADGWWTGVMVSAVVMEHQWLERGIRVWVPKTSLAGWIDAKRAVERQPY
jgi:hypothetical protein